MALHQPNYRAKPGPIQNIQLIFRGPTVKRETVTTSHIEKTKAERLLPETLRFISLRHLILRADGVVHHGLLFDHRLDLSFSGLAHRRDPGISSRHQLAVFQDRIAIVDPDTE